MANVTPQSVVRQINSLFEGSSVAGLSDRQLLDRFTAQRDAASEAAFAALVARHGAMVLSVCFQLLADRHHAEDAFQAVFLVLARRARSVRDPDLLSNWLYGIALRTARKARNRLGRQRRSEAEFAVPHSEPSSTMTSEQAAIAREQAETLHAEIERLPGVFRVPVVLCYFEGLTLDQAALRLRRPAGTIHSRLVRAREKLGRALARRGIVVPAAAIAVLSPASASAAVSSQLCESAVRAAIESAASQSASPVTVAAALAHEVLRHMLYQKLKIVSLTLLVLGAVATSAAHVGRAFAANDDPKRSVAIGQTPIASKPDDASSKPAPGRMFVVGRVLDPQGTPVPRAAVTASVRVKFSSYLAAGYGRPILTDIGHVDADGSGRFRVDAVRTSSSRNDVLVVIALAPGYGVGWTRIDPDADQPMADITLQPEQVIQGRVFDVQGRPVRDASISVSSVQHEDAHELTSTSTGELVADGPIYEWTQVNEFSCWPKPTSTDADGRYTIHGVGRRRKVGISVIDPRYALENIDVQTDDAPGAKAVTTSLQPARIFTGRVTDADSGKPIAYARLEFRTAAGRSAGSRRLFRLTKFQADADGRYRANPSPGERFDISARPANGSIYMEGHKTFDWPKGAVEQSFDLALTRGAAIRGKVVEAGTSQPIAAAIVTFQALSRADGNRPADRPVSTSTSTSADGSFELAVLPRAGHLVVQAPSDDYVLHEFGVRELTTGQRAGQRVYANDFAPVDPSSSNAGLNVRVALRRGITISGRIVGPDDQLVEDVWIIGRAALQPIPVAWRGWAGSYHRPAPSGRFEIHGIVPESDFPVYFFQPKRRLAALVQLTGKAAGGTLTVRLEPCGSATARLVDARGRPLSSYRNTNLISSNLIRMILTPGPEWASRDPADATRLFMEMDSLSHIDPINYPREPATDAQGRISFPALIPGATYRISDFSTLYTDKRSIQLRKEFAVKPGESVELGDILLENPESR
jgi:RNA polymerase sigma factor (sigma-70 family)